MVIPIAGSNENLRISIGEPMHPVGSVDIRRVSEWQAQIRNLSVAPENRRHGIGTRLVQAAIHTAARLRVSNVVLEVHPSPGSISGLALTQMYTKLGFQRSGISPRGNPMMERHVNMPSTLFATQRTPFSAESASRASTTANVQFKTRSVQARILRPVDAVSPLRTCSLLTKPPEVANSLQQHRALLSSKNPALSHVLPYQGFVRSNRGTASRVVQRMEEFPIPVYTSDPRDKSDRKYYGLGPHKLEEDATRTACPFCEDNSRHIGFSETRWGSSFLGDLLQRLVQQQPTMLGIMTCGNRVFMANSGKNRGEIRAAAEALFEYQNQSPQHQQYTFTWIASSSMTRTDARTVGGQNIPAQMVDNCQYENMPFSCAAPKLITYAIKQNFDLYQVKISEVWAGGGENHALSVWSCKTCQRLLYLLTCTAF